MKKVSIILLILGVCAGVLTWWQYGIYDTRDLPEKILIRSNNHDGYHLNASITYEPIRQIPMLCKGLFAGSGWIANDFDDIPSGGAYIAVKKKWGGLCKYQFDGIGINCNKSMRDKINGLPFYSRIGIALNTDETIQLFGTRLTLETKNEKVTNTECDFPCDADPRPLDFHINSHTNEIEISCKDGK